MPHWQSASFWPLISDETGFIREVLAHVELPREREYYVPGKSGTGPFGRVMLPFKMIAVFHIKR